MNILIGLFIIFNLKKFFIKDNRILKSEEIIEKNIKENFTNLETIMSYSSGSETKEINTTKPFYSNQNNKEYSFDVKSNIYLFIDL